MGLYLCIFDGDDEIDGVDIGSYADFNALREYIVDELEGGNAGSRFPTLVLHSDCDGEWSAAKCELLRVELDAIAAGMKVRSPVRFSSAWQATVACSIDLIPNSALQSFIDADGDPLLDRIQALVSKALERNLPIFFQ